MRYCYHHRPSSNCNVMIKFAIFSIYKSQNAPVPLPTMLPWERKYAHFCSQRSIVGWGTGAYWDLRNWSIDNENFDAGLLMYFCSNKPDYLFEGTQTLRLKVQTHSCQNIGAQSLIACDLSLNINSGFKWIYVDSHDLKLLYKTRLM